MKNVLIQPFSKPGKKPDDEGNDRPIALTLHNGRRNKFVDYHIV